MRGDELARTGPALVAPVTTAASARAYTRAVVDACWNAPARPAREEDVIDLLLVVSEMVSNAIRHGGGLAGFDVTPVHDGIRLAVHDHSDVVPSAAYGSGALPAVHHGNGYGWPLIIKLAREITIARRPSGGKTISVFVPVRAARGTDGSH
ncbi:ATP-binding protein [Streptomyces sp. NPDC014995]|uniref:ATP-binding protein n=1 Tax=Streptomyces sp. NPDC014995 TaxID=3364936 RepID=UPI0036FD8907